MIRSRRAPEPSRRCVARTSRTKSYQSRSCQSGTGYGSAFTCLYAATGKKPGRAKRGFPVVTASHRSAIAWRNAAESVRGKARVCGSAPAPGATGTADGDVLALDVFSPATRAWFDGAFAEPTQAQAGAWQAIGKGEDTLVVAPTGSGKTLAAFLWAIDKLAAVPPPADPKRRTRVLYVSPLKALAVDIERNLRAPLTGIGHAAHRLGLDEPDIRVAVRTGDTAAEESRKLAVRPPDILITTPESLFLLLTSQARETLRGVETVILDEVHAVAGNKRGAHLALSLERLDALRAEASPASGEVAE